jgi:hypothetical protein
MNANDREALADLISNHTVGIESKSGEVYDYISLELIEKIGEHFEGDNSLCFYEMRCQHGPDAHDIDIPAWCARARGESALDTGECAGTECPCHCHA